MLTVFVTDAGAANALIPVIKMISCSVFADAAGGVCQASLRV